MDKVRLHGINLDNKFLVLSFSTVTCTFLALYVTLVMHMTIVYTHFFYIPIILAGMWYQKKALYVALGLGIIHILVTYISPIPISISEFERATIFMAVAYVIGSVSEKRAEAEDELRNSHKQLLDTIDFLPDATFVIDRDRKVVAWNLAIEDMTGVGKENIIGEAGYAYAVPFCGNKRPTLVDLIFQSEEEIETSYDYVKREGDKLFAETFTPLLYGGKGAYIWITASPLYDSEGKVIGAIESVRDITEIRHYQDALEKTNKKLNLLNSVTRHDMSNHIMAANGFVYLLDQELSLSPKEQEYTEKIKDILGRVMEQIKFTRDYQDMGVKPLEWQNIEEMVQKAASTSPLLNIELQVKIGKLKVYADPLLEKVFSNLFENSVRHGEYVTEIQVSFLERNSRGVIVVEDNGIGIPADCKIKIFDRKFGKNTGYGLFLARDVLGITGMIIRETGLEGKGARFEIEIPRGYYRIAQGSDDAVNNVLDGRGMIQVDGE